MVEEKQGIKVVVVGDRAVGKTSLIMAYGENRFSYDYIPRVSETYEGPYDYEGREVTLKIVDAYLETFAAIHPVSYNNADCFLVCFSLSDKDTLKNACNKWKKELTQLGPENCPKVLVGTKSDLRDHKISLGETEDVVTPEFG